MNVSQIYLLLGGLGLGLSLLTFFRVRVAAPLLVPTFLIAWLRGEAVLWTLTKEILGTVAFVAYGGILEETAGRIGLGLFVLSWSVLWAVHRRALGAGRELDAGLSGMGLAQKDRVSAWHGFPNPFAFSDPAVERIHHLEYGPSLPGDQGGRNRLDVVRPRQAKSGDRRPVLLQVHGGAWMIGDKREQGRPLMTHLAREGWVCVAINYRLSPKATMPAHIIDVKRAIGWIRAHIAEYGGDPDFVCITGGSAGGHLCSLAALTTNDPRFQPGFEDVDTGVAACVPFYGVFDFLDRAGDRPLGTMQAVAESRIFQCSAEAEPALWDSVCPVLRVHAKAPPFFVIQGSHDSLVMVEEARTFVTALQAASEAPVLYAELKGAQHAFDVFHSPRTEAAVRAVGTFLTEIRRRHETDGEENASAG
jgi:acetyl esterase/lipase